MYFCIYAKQECISNKAILFTVYGFKSIVSHTIYLFVKGWRWGIRGDIHLLQLSSFQVETISKIFAIGSKLYIVYDSDILSSDRALGQMTLTAADQSSFGFVAEVISQ